MVTFCGYYSYYCNFQFDSSAGLLLLQLHVLSANLLSCLLCAPWRLVWLVSGHWWFGNFMCKLAHFLMGASYKGQGVLLAVLPFAIVLTLTGVGYLCE